MHQVTRNALLSSAVLVLSACGGGGSTGTAFIPAPPVTPAPPPPPPPPPPTTTVGQNYIVAATGPNQAFDSRGEYVSFDFSSGKVTGGSTVASDQLKIRYNSAAGQYEIQVPQGASWDGIHLNPNESPNTGDFLSSGGNPVGFGLQQFAGTGYSYSALAAWGSLTGLDVIAHGAMNGAVAFGIPTPAGSVPITGSATYDGSVFGHSTETSFDQLAGGYWPAWVEGSINLSFNFGSGTLAGSISPTIYNHDRRAIPSMSFVNTVYASGATSFSGSFNTSLAGANSFSGEFTGPQAQELIGSFEFPYTSAEDGKPYQASGAFVAKKP